MENIYYRTPIKEVIKVNKIVTIHYFEFARDYIFKGEKHDFWEFLYVDKGEVEIMADTKGYKLEQGDIVFHRPNEFHSVWANGVIAPNIVVISFECDSKKMRFFEKKILKLSPTKRNLLGEIMKESKDAYSNILDPFHTKLNRNAASKFGAEQLIKVYLELFLIGLIRDSDSVLNKERVSSVTKDRMEEDLINNIIEFLKNNVEKNYSFEDICLKFCIGKTHLKTLFKKRTNLGVISYFRMLKIEEAKKLIREGKNNFTEIAEMLGYDSVHYFSRTFKKYTDMSPSEYAISIKAIAHI